MRKTILATVCVVSFGALAAGGALAQTSAPAGQDATKMGAPSTTGQGMSSGSMAKGDMMKAPAHKKKAPMKKDMMKK